MSRKTKAILTSKDNICTRFEEHNLNFEIYGIEIERFDEIEYQRITIDRKIKFIDIDYTCGKIAKKLVFWAEKLNISQ